MSKALRNVSRIGGVTEAGGDDILENIFSHIIAKRGHILNIHQVVAHSPRMLKAQAAYALALREESLLPRSLQELLILRIAQVNDSEYEQTVHRPIALECGVSQKQIDDLSNWRNAGSFEAREQIALAFIDQAAATGEVDEQVFSGLQESFSKREIVELAALVGWYVGNSRFVRALRIAPQV